jgi:hypothetical protein
LDRPTLDSLDRKFTVAQLRKVSAFHQTLDAGFDDFLDDRLNDSFTVRHLNSSIELNLWQDESAYQ